MNTTFDIHRFARLFKWNLISNKRHYLQGMVAIAVAFSFVSVAHLTDLDGESAHRIALRVDSFAKTLLFCACAYVMLSGTSIFVNLRSKQQRIAFLLQPASNLEKFLVRFIGVMVVIPLGALAAMAFADLIQMLYSTLSCGQSCSIFTILYNHFGHNPSEMGFVYGMMISLHAFYVFCGTFYSKHQFPLALCTQFAIFILALFIGIENSDWLIVTFHDSNGDCPLWAWMGGHSLIALVLYVASYKIFCRMQAVNNKWINL